MLGVHRLGERAHCVVVGDVERLRGQDGAAAVADLARGRLQSVVVAVGEHELRALTRRGDRGRPSDAARRAGDEDAASAELGNRRAAHAQRTG